MAEDWSRHECEAIVADYFAMLELELRGEPYSKTDHRRVLLSQLGNRSGSSVEFKHANISAILIEIGFPYIDGYKPRSNYQAVLSEVVTSRLPHSAGVVAAAAADVEIIPTIELPTTEELARLFVDPPRRDAAAMRVGEKRYQLYLSQALPPANFLEREARNRELGLAGEEFVLRVEQARLIGAGQERLAGRIEHVSKTRGDGLGYDVLSFETDSRERLIEVKTTKYGQDTPFFVTRNELSVSQAEGSRYHLYRLFAFRRVPKVFTLAGELSTTCVLEPVSFHARVNC